MVKSLDVRVPYLHGDELEGRGMKGIMCSHLNGFFYGGKEDVEEEVVNKLKKKLELESEETVNVK